MSGAERSAAVCDISPSARLMSHYFSSALALALRLAERAFSSLGKHIPRANQLVCSKATADIVRDNYGVALGALEVFGGGASVRRRRKLRKKRTLLEMPHKYLHHGPTLYFQNPLKSHLHGLCKNPTLTHTLSTNTVKASTAAQLKRPDSEKQKIAQQLQHFDCNVKYV